MQMKSMKNLKPQSPLEDQLEDQLKKYHEVERLVPATLSGRQHMQDK